MVAFRIRSLFSIQRRPSYLDSIEDVDRRSAIGARAGRVRGARQREPAAGARLIRSAIFMVEFADLRNVRQRQHAPQVKPRLERI